MGVNTDNVYLTMDITIPANTNNYSLMEENSSIFYDWNYDWNERRYFTNFLLKDLSNIIEVSFHKDYNQFITITETDVPFVLEDFVYRDVYFNNNNLEDVTFTLILLSPQSLPKPPNKPTDLKYEIIDNTIKLIFNDNSENETFFVIERSDVSAISSFGVIAEKKYPVEQVVGSIEREYIDNTVTTGNTYWYRIKTRKNNTDSFYSNVIEVML